MMSYQQKAQEILDTYFEDYTSQSQNQASRYLLTFDDDDTFEFFECKDDVEEFLQDVEGWWTLFDLELEDYTTPRESGCN